MVMGTAVEGSETVVDEIQDAGAISAVVEPDVSEVAETDGPLDTTETDAPGKPDLSALLGELDDDGLESLPQVKALLSRRQESARQKSERETSQRLAYEKDKWVTQGQWIADLSAAYGFDDVGNVQVDKEKVTHITGDLAAYALTSAAESIIDHVNKAVDFVLPEDFAVTKDESTRLQESFADFKADPSKAGAYVGQLLDVVRRATIEGEKVNIIKDARKDWEREQTTKAKATSVREADEANSDGGAPTNMRGSVGGRGITPDELAAMPNEVFLAKPREEQQRLIDQAKVNAARTSARR